MQSLKATLYARFSPRPDAATSDSNEKQIERCTAYCIALGHTLAGVYDDAEMSGANAANRPGLQAALDEVCENKGILVCYDLSRLARNTTDAIEINTRLQAAGANLAFVVGSIDTSTPMGRVFFTLMAAIAQMQREEISLRTRAGMRRRIARGECMGQVPYGYRRNGANLEPEPVEQTIIAKIRTLHAGGNNTVAIQRILQRDGDKARGKRWHRSLISRLLR